MDYKCDTCGAVATQMARDIKEKLLSPDAIWREYESYGSAKLGCDEHPVASVTFGVDGALRGRES